MVLIIHAKLKVGVDLCSFLGKLANHLWFCPPSGPQRNLFFPDFEKIKGYQEWKFRIFTSALIRIIIKKENTDIRNQIYQDISYNDKKKDIIEKGIDLHSPKFIEEHGGKCAEEKQDQSERNYSKPV